MKKLIIYGLSLMIWMGGCTKEDKLSPTKIKNWFEIKEKPDMDAIDRKIYEIWKSYTVGIFYNDTLGYEDRGRIDSAGNPLYHYEILNLSYDMGSTTGNSQVNWSRVDVSTPDGKARLMPLLELLDKQLLAFVKGAEVNIPAIMITETLNKGGVRKVYRGFNFLAINLGNFNTGEETIREYRAEFINQTCAKKIENSVSSFYKFTEAALNHLTSNPWDGYYSGYGTLSLFPEYNEVNNAIYELDHYDEDMEELLRIKAEQEALLESGEVTDSTEYKACLADIAHKEELKSKEESYRDYYEVIRPEAYGLLALTGPYGTPRIPSKSEDLDMYMAAVFTYSAAQFEVLYRKYPVSIARFNELKAILEQAGFDVDRVRESS